MYLVEAYKYGLTGNKTCVVLRQDSKTYGPVVIPWNHLCPSQRTTFSQCLRLIEDVLENYFEKHLGITNAKEVVNGIVSSPSVSVYQKSGNGFIKNNKLLEKVVFDKKNPDPVKMISQIKDKFSLSDYDFKLQFYYSTPENVKSVIPHLYIMHYAGIGEHAKYVVQFYGMREIKKFVEEHYPKSFFSTSVSDMIHVNLDFGKEIFIKDSRYLEILELQKNHNDSLKQFNSVLNFGENNIERKKLIDDLVLNHEANNCKEIKINYMKFKLKNHFGTFESNISEIIDHFEIKEPEVNVNKPLPFLINNNFSSDIFDDLPKTYQKDKEKLCKVLSVPSYLIEKRKNLKNSLEFITNKAKSLDNDCELEVDNVLFIHFSTNKWIRGKL